MSVDANSSTAPTTDSSFELGSRYREVRGWSESLCAPLQPEDYVVQSMVDASPAKWHLAHTTWFFEEFVLQQAGSNYEPFDPQFSFLFNSYYNAVGDRHPRPRRGMLTRPTIDEVYKYRHEIDVLILELLEGELSEQTRAVIEVGLHHEQQHQELLLTDVKHLLSNNPLRPAYRTANDAAPTFKSRHNGDGNGASRTNWLRQPEGLYTVGHDGEGFCYDNETPQHRVFLQTFELGSQLVTNAEYQAFVEDDGYTRAELWLSDGWDAVRKHGWHAPLYWERDDDGWSSYTLHGMLPLDEAGPVCHVSFYEADAYTRWVGARLPLEAEWEVVAAAAPAEGNFADSEQFHPLQPQSNADSHWQLFGDVWEWTASPYAAYPGYRPPEGALGEYNGKFMCNQMVLRGGSCATPPSHIRATYRNFFYPDARWQFSGIRLARDAQSH